MHANIILHACVPLDSSSIKKIRVSCTCCKDSCTNATHQQVQSSLTSTPSPATPCMCMCTHTSECEASLQSPSYSEAIMRAHTPFLHHYILECNHSGLKYTFDDHDITLKIPKGAVAKGQTIHMEFDVALYGHFVFSKNTQPISPIVWLCLLEEEARLSKPFQLILPHFLTRLTQKELHHHQVGFVKAAHSSSMTVSQETLIGKRICHQWKDSDGVEQWYYSNILSLVPGTKN